VNLLPSAVPVAGDFLLADRRVRPSRNLVERPASQVHAAARTVASANAAPGGEGAPAGAGGLAPDESGALPAAAVQIEPKVMAVLVCLARRAGRVVSKDELVQEVWEGRYVSDDVVWRSVRELRRALGDEARQPRFIETIPKRGYRLLAPVAEIPEPGSAAPAAAPAAARAPASAPASAAAPATMPVLRPFAGPPAAATAEPRCRGWVKHRPAVAAALGLAASLALTLAGWWWWRGAGRPRVPPPLRVAVLPLANLSGDADQEYFADGLTEELISRLGSLRPGRLAVVGRTSVMALKGHGGDAAAIGGKLAVAYLLEGGVRRDGERARVTVRLIRAADGAAIWGERLDVALGQTLQAESAIAERVASELAVELLPPTAWPGSRPPPGAAAAVAPPPASATALGADSSIAAAGAAASVAMVDAGSAVTAAGGAAASPAVAARSGTAGAADPLAHDRELRGRYLLARANPAALARAVTELRAAADLDPAAAAPRSGLADAYHLLAVLGMLPPAVAYPRAEEAALAAIARDPSSVEALTVLGSIRFRYAWDYAGAERDFRRALALNPSYAPAHHDQAWLLVALGRMDEGIAEVREAQRLEPLSLRAIADLGWVLYRAGRPEEAIAAMRGLLELEPGFTAARDCLERALARRGELAAALAVAREGLRREGAVPEQVTAGAPAADPAAALRRIAAWRLARLSSQAGYVSPYAAAALMLDSGDPAGALAALERAVAGHDPMAVMMAVDPELAPLRSDRRFAGLERRLGLPPAR